MTQKDDQRPHKDRKANLNELMNDLKLMHEQKQQRYEAFLGSIKDLQPLEKAVAWLKYIAENEDTYGSQEAIVYLVVRGHDCSKRIKDMVTAWKQAERRSIESFVRGRTVFNLKSGETHTGPRRSYTEASDIVNLSPYSLRDFWGGTDYQEFSIDSTMLRTVEWCNIGGFDGWWLRLAKLNYELAVQGGVEPIPAAFYLFNLCRSDYAIKLMYKSLVRILEANEIPQYGQPYPWRRWREERTTQTHDHLIYAASIAFADERLRSDHETSSLVSQALETLLKYQDVDGAWRCWADDIETSIEATAMAIHALALKKSRGWKLAVSAARDWLLANQDQSGCWIDPSCPDSVYLTVLVLDAIELSGGGSKVTFALSGSSVQPAIGAQSISNKIGDVSVNKVKALFLSANPADTHQLNLDEQIRLITEKLRATAYRDVLELISAWAVRPDDLLQYLNEHKPHIVHFSGHGSLAEEILVVNSQGYSQAISTQAIKSLFKTLKDNVRVVILDACYSYAQAEALADLIDCTIGMGDAIGQEAANVFTASFYRAIGFGRSIQEAFDQGLTALLLEGIPEENTPKLLTRPDIDPSRVYLITGVAE